MAKTELPPEIAGLSFEDALAQLEDIVGELETGQAKLDEAIEFYERGALLKRHCEDKLRQAQARIDRIVEAADGALETESLETAPLEAEPDGGET